ncbi:MAG: ABC transporter ATP-binding protein [Ruminococcus sp.]|nr:ABC transporter ATP-binding protein [Candidatus Apopatosoma intestinale]
MPIILETRNLCKTYGAVPALDHMDMTLMSGRIIGLLGPNGSGKTTLIKLAAGLLTPTSGTLTVGGIAPGAFTKSAVSYLPERTYLDPAMTVNEAIKLFEDFYQDFDAKRACEMFARLGVDTKRKIKTLSKGTREKVQLVLVMSRHAKLYLLDEPIAGVDPAARDLILHTIISNYEPDSTVLISTHLISDIEPILDEFVFIKDGKAVLHDTVDHVREEQGKTVDMLFREVFRCYENS